MLRNASLIPLSRQHHNGLVLAVIIERSLRTGVSEHKVEELTRKVMQLAEVELLGHFKLEEEVLFPRVRGVFDSEEIIDKLISQHRQMEKLLLRLPQVTKEDRISLLAEFGRLLSSHIRMEERQVFEEIQNRLSDDDLMVLGKQIGDGVQKVCFREEKLP